LAGFGLVPSLQLRVIALAGDGADLAATLGASAVNAGIALGALAGGRVLATHGVRPVALTAALIGAVAVPAAWATGMLRARSATVDGQPSGGPAVADTAGRVVPEGVAADD
jgi:DHA1 family inner membrane transport protein